MSSEAVRVLGMMLLTHQYDNQEICIMGYPKDVSITLY